MASRACGLKLRGGVMSIRDIALMDSAIDKLKECILEMNPLLERLDYDKSAIDDLPQARKTNERELSKVMMKRIWSLSDQIVMLEKEEWMAAQRLAANISKMAKDTLEALENNA